MTVKVRSFADGKRPSEVVSVRFVQSKKYKAAGVPSKPSPTYPGQGLNGFLSYGDGIRGNVDDIRDGNWIGFEGTNMEIVLELPKIKSLTRIEAGFLQELGSWIFLPKQVDFLTSMDGESYQKVGLVSHVTKASDKEKKVVDLGVDLKGKKAKFVKIVAENVGVCPEWHAGAGGKCWIFCDEIMVQ